MSARIALVILAASACSGDGYSLEHARLGSLGFDVPADWNRTDSTRRGVATAEWQPDDNDRKESITVIYSELSPAVAQAGVPTIEPYLAAAQRSLPDVRASRVRSITTRQGFAGARVDLDFIPVAQHEPYRRAHAVLVDGSALVHVIYTARLPDRALTTLDLVLDNLRHEGE